MESDCKFYAYADDGQFLPQHLGGEPACNGGGVGDQRKRRFTEEQVRSLESTFHSRRAKLEPREKAALARELGLHPRQVAIWFQNKRARWRSKQLEQDFADLRAHYDHLHARVEALKRDKLTLAGQLEELKGKLNERQDQSASSDDTVAEVDWTTGSMSSAASWRPRRRWRRTRPLDGTSTTTWRRTGVSCHCQSPSAPLRSCGRRHGRSWSGTRWHESTLHK